MAVPQEAQCPFRNGSFPDSTENVSYSVKPVTDSLPSGERDWNISISCDVVKCGLCVQTIVKMQSDEGGALRSGASVLSSRCETREFIAG